jgi:hypothetical protein
MGWNRSRGDRRVLVDRADAIGAGALGWLGLRGQRAGA